MNDILMNDQPAWPQELQQAIDQDPERYKLRLKAYSLAEAFGPEFSRDSYVMGFAPSKCRFVPRRDRYYRWDRTLLRDLIVWWMEGNNADAVYLYGPTGSGKSSAIRNFCASLHIPLYEKTLHQQVELNDLVYMRDLIDGTTVTSFSWLTLAMGAEGWPGIFVANELDRADPNMVIGLHEILEGQPLLMHMGALDLLEPAACFRIVSTGNTALSGDLLGTYTTAKVQDMASADREWMYKVGYLEAAQEEIILGAVVPRLKPAIRTKMIEFANDVRAAFMRKTKDCIALPVTMSTRSLRRWARLCWFFRGGEDASVNPIAYSLERAWLRRVEGMDDIRKAIITLAQGRFGPEYGQFE